MTDEQIQALLDEFDVKSPPGSHERRADERYRYRVSGCVIQVAQPGAGGSVSYSMPTRNLSASGIAVIHGNYVHPKTPCSVQLISSHGSWETVTGKVAACRHVKGLIHEVGIQFDRRIDVGMYCPDAVKSRILLVDDDPLIVRLVEKHLHSLNAELKHVDDGEKAVQEALAHVYDVVLMDMEMPVLNGFEATQRLRSQGYTGRIVAATGYTGSADREKCLKAGCDSYLAKPYTRQALVELLRSLQQEPLFSSMSNDPTMVDLINSFVEGLPARLRAIEEAHQKRDAAALESLARRLKGEAGGYGFDPITDAAAALESTIKNDPGLERIKSQLDKLVSYCQLARTSTTKAG
ncbi:MAG: response regulator [Phycisphaerales bacterium]|nr:response regulator [Phycisphaerales bacterium]